MRADSSPEDISSAALTLRRFSDDRTIVNVDCPAYSLLDFGLREMAECGGALRDLGEQAPDLETFAGQAALYFQHNLLDGDGDPACALVRFFIEPLFTASKDWLNSGEFAECGLHFSNLFEQLGLGDLKVCGLEESAEEEREPRTYELVYVADVIHQPNVQVGAIPAGTTSLLGLGCRLPSNRFFALVLFVRIPITRNTAELFRTITLNLRLASLRFDRQSISAGGGVF